MYMRMKLLIITIILIVMVILPISFGLPKKKIVTEVEGNLKDYVQIDDLSFDEKEGLWTITAQIKNMTNRNLSPSSFIIIAYDAEKNEIFRSSIEIGNVIHVGEKKQISMTTPTNLENAITCRYEVAGEIVE